MTTRPILFSGPMVRRIRRGSKWQTRRIMTPQPAVVDGFTRWESPRYDNGDGVHYFHTGSLDGVMPAWVRASPYGVPGDHLYVREAVRWDAAYERAFFDADGEPTVIDTWPWKRPRLPGIHMPRGAARIWLRVTEIAVERVNAITEIDAVAEGAMRHEGIPDPHPHGQGPRWSMFDPTSTEDCLSSARLAFANAWSKINGEDAWESNPWVWVVSFEPADKPRPL